MIKREMCIRDSPLLREDENQAWWLLSTLVDQVLGEIPAMALIRGFDISDTPLDGEMCIRDSP